MQLGLESGDSMASLQTWHVIRNLKGTGKVRGGAICKRGSGGRKNRCNDCAGLYLPHTYHCQEQGLPFHFTDGETKGFKGGVIYPRPPGL